jgi:hypothetical protein
LNRSVEKHYRCLGKAVPAVENHFFQFGFNQREVNLVAVALGFSISQRSAAGNFSINLRCQDRIEL